MSIHVLIHEAQLLIVVQYLFCIVTKVQDVMPIEKFILYFHSCMLSSNFPALSSCTSLTNWSLVPRLDYERRFGSWGGRYQLWGICSTGVNQARTVGWLIAHKLYNYARVSTSQLTRYKTNKKLYYPRFFSLLSMGSPTTKRKLGIRMRALAMTMAAIGLIRYCVENQCV